FHLEAIQPGDDAVTLILRAHRSVVDCPTCGSPTDRIHSWYQRRLADLPWQGLTVQLDLTTRRWFCRNPSCPRQIFTERFPDVVAPSARRTTRLAGVVDAVALALGGEAGGRLLAALGVTLSPDTLLNALRRATLPAPGPLHAVGIDDWSWRRGHRYGTIIVDLERHRVVDLLRDREPATISAWLRQHPEITVIARDRGDAMIQAATTGAPQARQVVDRWHLLHNLTESLEEVLLAKRCVLRQAATAADGLRDDDTTLATAVAPGPLTPHRPRHGVERAAAVREQRQACIVAQYDAIRRLQLAGADVADIARTVGVSRQTVYRYRDLPEPPGPKQPHRGGRVLDPYIPYLLKRWAAGCHNGMRLWRELRAQGFTHGASNVARFTAQLRRQEAAGQPIVTTSRSPTLPTPSPRHVAGLLLRRPADLTLEEQQYLATLRQHDAELATAYALSQAFATMVRERQGERFVPWLQAVEAAVAVELGPLRRFARGLRRDDAAVQAGLSEPWSNGQTEGQVHRLKLFKRQMVRRVTRYGIAPAGSRDRRDNSGSSDQPGAERQRGKQHVRNAGAASRPHGLRPARPAPYGESWIA
ncbi:MAG TPA: ISL3 family transposase, partial [Thermomicrobiaceae bacterium]|nr:ISL3 family transposase [Thermomicrobiaceae bacterium]